MPASALGLIVRECRSRAVNRLGSEGAAAIDAIVSALDRFADRPPEEFVERLAAVKPRRARTANGTAVDKGVVDSYVTQLSRRTGDHAATLEIMARIRADRAVKKAEAVAIAKAVGARTSSKTQKAQALDLIEGASSARARDKQLAEQIRKGA